jgi:hypothetical protein
MYGHSANYAPDIYILLLVVQAKGKYLLHRLFFFCSCLIFSGSFAALIVEER